MRAISSQLPTASKRDVGACGEGKKEACGAVRAPRVYLPSPREKVPSRSPHPVSATSPVACLPTSPPFCSFYLTLEDRPTAVTPSVSLQSSAVARGAGPHSVADVRLTPDVFPPKVGDARSLLSPHLSTPFLPAPDTFALPTLLVPHPPPTAPRRTQPPHRTR